MATGIFGGMLFSTLYLSSFYMSFSIIGRSLIDGWIATFCINRLISSLFSGALYSNAMFWVSIALVITTSSRLKTRKVLTKPNA